ncbi:hypothetical protein AYK20_08035 [Thermoplasmatales archaeon SG8-52-1]|nr:MAG: hypothetical protein AYK20_08035 [Thermoplasmatales archaeon SG8-52-1]
MSVDIRNISKKAITLEIFNTFELFKQTKSISIVEYLKNFDTTCFKQQKYRKIKFSYDSLIKLVLYQKLKGIKFQTQLRKYLKKHKKERYRLGFDRLPDRRTINYFINHILTDETKELLDYTTCEIIRISEKFEIIFDINLLKPEKPIKETKERNQYILRDKKTREVSKILKRRITPFIDLRLGKNCIYKKKEFIELFIHLGLNQNFAESGSKIFKELKGISPNADTFFYHLKKYTNIQEVQDLYTRLFEIIWEITKQSNAFDIRRRVDLAVDYHEWFFYGNRKAIMVMGKMPERGTDKCYKFITINIVENGKRFTLLALPVGHFDTKEGLLTKLIYFAKKRIKIRRIYVDRGFFDSKSIETLQRHHTKYLIPCTENPRIKKILNVASPPRIIKDYDMKNTKFNVAIVKDENNQCRAFATNIDFNEDEVGLSERLFYLYSKRWGIETSYRVKKHSFRAKTTSKNYNIRLFYFLFSVLLYNLWILADILIWFHLFGFIGEGHRVTSKVFGTIFITVDPGG